MINEYVIQKGLCEIAFLEWLDLEYEEQEMEDDTQVLGDGEDLRNFFLKEAGSVGINSSISARLNFRCLIDLHVQMSNCGIPILWLLGEEVWKSNINLSVISMYLVFEFQEERVCQERVES